MLLARAKHTQGRPERVCTRDGRELFAMILDGPRCGAAEAAGAICPRPTVVFEADLAGTRSDWALVQRIVGRSARAIVYDRAGLGRSPEDPEGRDIERMADDLNDLLSHFGPGPYVLVGHGAGAPVVRAAARKRRQRISGLVLVDPADEHAEQALLPVGAPRAALRRLAGTLADAALARTSQAPSPWLPAPLAARLSAGRDLPDDVRADLAAQARSTTGLRTARRTQETWARDLRAWRADPPRSGRTPVTVVSAGSPGAGIGRTQRAALNAAHRQAAAELRDARHVILPGVDHDLPRNSPEALAREIHALAGCLPGRRAFTPHPWIA